MPVKYVARLFAFNKKGFEKNGEKVEYNECIFLNENDNGTRSVLILNTKQDFSELIDKEGTLEVEIDLTGKNKPRLVSFSTAS